MSAHCGSVSVVDATCLGRAFNAAATELTESAITPDSRQRSRMSDGRTGTRRRAIDLVEKRRGLVVEHGHGPSGALESAPAVLIRPAEALHHSVDRDARDGRQLHGFVHGLVAVHLVMTAPRGGPHRSSMAHEGCRSRSSSASCGTPTSGSHRSTFRGSTTPRSSKQPAPVISATAGLVAMRCLLMVRVRGGAFVVVRAGERPVQGGPAGFRVPTVPGSRR